MSSSGPAEGAPRKRQRPHKNSQADSDPFSPTESCWIHGPFFFLEVLCILRYFWSSVGSSNVLVALFPRFHVHAKGNNSLHIRLTCRYECRTTAVPNDSAQSKVRIRLTVIEFFHL